ncbi:MAG: YibE/F family protein [Treponemataceae bacterium]
MHIKALGGDRRRDLFFVLATALASAALFLSPTGFEKTGVHSAERVKARVVEVNNDNVKTIGPVRHGEQQLEILVLSGRFAGTQAATHNTLYGKLELDKIFKPGDTAFVVLDLSADGSAIAYANVLDHYRIDATLILIGLFSICLIAFAGWTGLKALLSFVFSGALIVKLLLPALLRGWDPVWTAFGVVAILTAVIIFLVGGFTRKGAVAFIGSMGGVALTSILALVFTKLFNLRGAVRPFTETLLYSGFDYLDLSGLFIAGIFLASSGAVMDLGMDIAAAMHELSEKNPNMSRQALIRSGFFVGRHVVGTMTTTLLLAYTGGYTALIMTFIAQGIPFANVLNMIYVSAELVHTMVGSFGLILVAPVTAITGGFLFTAKSPKQRANDF